MHKKVRVFSCVDLTARPKLHTCAIGYTLGVTPMFKHMQSQFFLSNEGMAFPI